VAEEVYAAGAGVARERDRLFVDLFSVAALFTPSDFDADRVLCLRAGTDFDFGTASAERDEFGVTAGPISAVALRPRPSALEPW